MLTDPLLHEAETEFAQAAAAYERSIEKLRTLLAREEARWSPEERTRMAERLGRLDEAIARSRELARRTPGDSAGTNSCSPRINSRSPSWPPPSIAAARRANGSARDP